MIMLTKNFSQKELACSCCGQANMDKGFLIKLQELRDKWGKPIAINSGYRCAKHNTAVGGVQSSRHLAGDAVDIGIHNLNSEEKRALLKLIMDMGFTGVGLHQSFYHIDTRPGTPIIFFYGRPA